MTIETEASPALLTAREAASYLRISLSTLRRIERRGRLVPLRTPGGHRRYTRQALDACLVVDMTGTVAVEPSGSVP